MEMLVREGVLKGLVVSSDTIGSRKRMLAQIHILDITSHKTPNTSSTTYDPGPCLLSIGGIKRTYG